MANRTRPQQVDLTEVAVGMPVDIYRTPERKDVPGWRGPAVVMDVDKEANNVSVKWQGRILGIPLRHVRKHIGFVIAFIALFSNYYVGFACPNLQHDNQVYTYNVQVTYQDTFDNMTAQSDQDYFNHVPCLTANYENFDKNDLKKHLADLLQLQDLVDGNDFRKLFIHGRLWSQLHNDYTYLPTSDVYQKDTRQLELARHLAINLFKRPHLDGIRFGTALAALPPLANCHFSLLLLWKRTDRGSYVVFQIDPCIAFSVKERFEN